MSYVNRMVTGAPDNDDYIIGHQRILNQQTDTGRRYHYTTINGLHGILDSRSIYATHMAYLNDRQELGYGLDLIQSQLESHHKQLEWAFGEVDFSSDDPGKAAENISRLAVDTLGKFLEELPKTKRYLQKETPFVTCLSRSGDHLGQWRGYADSGGYAVVFDATKLAESVRFAEGSAAGGEISLVDVEYLPEALTEEIRDIGAYWTSFAFNLAGEEDEETRRQQVIEMWDKVLIIAARSKHKKFYEEREVRLIARTKSPFFQPSQTMGFLPRVALAFDPEAVVEIVVGPGDVEGIKRRSIEYWLQVNADPYEHVAVTESSIPYRNV